MTRSVRPASTAGLDVCVRVHAVGGGQPGAVEEEEEEGEEEFGY